MADIGRRTDRFRVLRVVLLARSLRIGFERLVEVVAGAVFSLAGRDKPGTFLADPHCAAPALNLDFEEGFVLDGTDPLMLGAATGELVTRFGQERMVDVIEGFVV